MKALALDTSLTCITISAKNDDNTVSLVLDIGMRQSEKLLPSIDFVLSELDLQAKDLDYTCLCKGPGSFTGLRLAFAALKAIELSHGVSVYGINTLDFIEWPHRESELPVISALDARKDKFFAQCKKGLSLILEPGDYEIGDLAKAFNEEPLKSEKKFFVAGNDSASFINAVKPLTQGIDFIHDKTRGFFCESLFEIAEDMISKKMPPLKEFEGPLYMRASEAEQKLGQ